MLKGKTSITVLLPLNLLIWGFTAFKIYSAFGNEETASSEISLPVEKLKEEDTLAYALSLDYNDPFLKDAPGQHNGYHSQSTRPADKPTPVKQPAQKEKDNKQLDVKYLGLIQNKTNGSTTALVSINGKSQLVRPGQMLEGLSFVTVGQDFIVIKDGKEKITISK